MFARISTGLVLAMLLGGPGALADETPEQASLVQSIFDQEEERLALMAVDKACSDRAQEIGFGPALAEYSLEDMTYLPDGAQPILGRDAMAAALGGPNGTTVTWAPENAFMSASMDLGVTWGRYVFSGKTPDGEPFEAHGKYTSVWKKDAEGQWKFALDIGNSNPKPAE